MIKSRPPSRSAWRKLTRTLAIGAVTMGMVIGLPATNASAGTRWTQGCFSLHHDVGWTTQTVYGYNNCRSTAGFRVINRTPGTYGITYRESCVSVAPYTQGGWRWTKGRNFLRVELC